MLVFGDFRFAGDTILCILTIFDYFLSFFKILQASLKDGIPSDLTSSISSPGDVTSVIKGETHQESVGEHGVQNPPTSCYNYYYPG